jgi:ABC-type enterochelin transport system permease subunit
LFLLLAQVALSDAFLLPLVALFWGGVVAIIDDPLAPQVVLSAGQ